MTQQNRKTTTPSYNNLVWQFHKVTRRNRVIFNLLQLVREKNDKALKGFLNQPEAFEDMLELLRENPSPRTEELYLYLKAYMHFSNMQLAQVWKILTESMLAKSSSLIYQRKIKALLAVLLDAYADRHSNDSYANKEAFERARCQYTLWLFCNDDFRSDEKMYATIISCLQQLRGKSVNSHETLHEIIGRKCNLLISYAELCEIVFGRKSNSTLEFNASVVKYLDDPIVQCKLITKYNTCQVAVLEHLICENSRLPLKATIKQAEQTLKSVICSEISASQTDETQATNTISVAALAAR